MQKVVLKRREKNKLYNGQSNIEVISKQYKKILKHFGKIKDSYVDEVANDILKLYVAQRFKTMQNKDILEELKELDRDSFIDYCEKHSIKANKKDSKVCYTLKCLMSLLGYFKVVIGKGKFKDVDLGHLKRMYLSMKGALSEDNYRYGSILDNYCYIINEKEGTSTEIRYDELFSSEYLPSYIKETSKILIEITNGMFATVSYKTLCKIKDISYLTITCGRSTTENEIETGNELYYGKDVLFGIMICESCINSYNSLSEYIELDDIIIPEQVLFVEDGECMEMLYEDFINEYFPLLRLNI